MTAHNYFHTDTVTDLSVIRNQAIARLKPDNKFGSATESVVHLHKHVVPCRGNQHEFYAQNEAERLLLRMRFWEAVIEAEEMETIR